MNLQTVFGTEMVPSPFYRSKPKSHPPKTQSSPAVAKKPTSSGGFFSDEDGDLFADSSPSMAPSTTESAAPEPEPESKPAKKKLAGAVPLFGGNVFAELKRSSSLKEQEEEEVDVKEGGTPELFGNTSSAAPHTAAARKPKPQSKQEVCIV